jgi:anti-sigma regulatory factor (Ser/Thr protein kinase)
MNDQLFFPAITETSQVAEARRLTGQFAAKLGFEEKEAGKVAIVLAEVGTNLVKHAGGGRLLVRALAQGNSVGLEVLALDQGPGIANVQACLQDGYSTSGSMGTGLGAIKRLSTLFDIYSLPGKGTALVAQLWAQAPKRKESLISPHPLQVGVVCLPKPGEEVSGDSWGVEQRGGRCLIMLVDGLGHGPEAATAAQAAVRTLRENPDLSALRLVDATHTALHRTRGAALAVIELELSRSAKFAGIGNIAGVIFNGEQKSHFTSYNGIVGHQFATIRDFVHSWSQEALMVLHSDGLASRWDLGAYPGLNRRHPSLIAGVLYRDFQRGYDDVTVLVIKE